MVDDEEDQEDQVRVRARIRMSLMKRMLGVAYNVNNRARVWCRSQVRCVYSKILQRRWPQPSLHPSALLSLYSFALSSVIPRIRCKHLVQHSSQAWIRRQQLVLTSHPALNPRFPPPDPNHHQQEYEAKQLMALGAKLPKSQKVSIV